MEFRPRQEHEMFRAAVARFARPRIFEIFQGTSEINRVIIAGQLGL